MTEPVLTQIGGWIYDGLRPIADPYDADRGYPLATYADGLGTMLQPLYDLVKDPSALLDADRTPIDWMPWLSQFTGAGLPVDDRRLRIPVRTNLVTHPSFEDGTATGYGGSSSTVGDPTATFVPTQDWSRYGSWSLRYQVTRSDGSSVVVRGPLGTSAVPVNPGAWYAGLVSGRLRNGYPGHSIRCRIYWWKSDGTASATSVTDGSSIPADNNGVYDLSIKAQAPSDAAFASVAFYFGSGGAFSLDVDVDAYAMFGLASSSDPIPAYGDGTFADWVWNGPTYNSTSSLMRDETDAEYRARRAPIIKDPPRRRRGTVQAVVDVITAYLLPGSPLYITERVGGNWKVGTVAARTSDLLATAPDGNPAYVADKIAYIQGKINEVKPAGSQITFSSVSGGNWQSVRDTHTDWADIRSTFVDWTEVRTNPLKQ